MNPIPQCNAEMEQVFDQINVVKLKLNSRMSVELVDAILNIRTRLKRDNIVKYVMIITVLRRSDNVKFYWHLFGMQ